MKVKKAVIPAAGLGTRFLPATKSMPKEMLPIIDTPVFQYVVEEAIESGIEDLIIITGRGKRAIEDYFDDSPELEMHLAQKHNTDLLKLVRDISSLVDIHYVRQKEFTFLQRQGMIPKRQNILYKNFLSRYMWFNRMPNTKDGQKFRLMI